MTSSTRFSGRTAIVTGAAGGIGQAIVESFCQEGAQVLAVDRSSRDCGYVHLDGTCEIAGSGYHGEISAAKNYRQLHRGIWQT